MKSTETAVLIRQYITQNEGATVKQIAGALAITQFQFQSAQPYFKRYCKRVLCKWYLVN